MSDAPIVPNPSPEAPAETTEVAGEYVSPKELEKLPPEMKTMVSVIAGIFRSTSGPDPETSKIVAQSEMHEESCKLEGYKESLRTRDKQNGRDHEFRKKRLNHETFRNTIISVVCVIGICTGLYLLVVKKDETLGSNILIASFLALLGGGKFIAQKDKD
jgi:hypothetical protein